MKKLIQIPEKCIGCGYCVDLDPLQWKMDSESGKAILIGASQKRKQLELDIFDEDIPFHQQIVDACPTLCIKIQ